MDKIKIKNMQDQLVEKDAIIHKLQADLGESELKALQWKELAMAADEIIQLSGIVACVGFENYQQLKQEKH